MNWFVNFCEFLKCMIDNNWVYVICVVWILEVKFGSVKVLCFVEGIFMILRVKFVEICKVCKRDGGVCVFCY